MVTDIEDVAEHVSCSRSYNNGCTKKLCGERDMRRRQITAQRAQACLALLRGCIIFAGTTTDIVRANTQFQGEVQMRRFRRGDDPMRKARRHKRKRQSQNQRFEE